MQKKQIFKKFFFLIFLLGIALVLISASSACIMESKEKIDSGKKILTVENEKYQINWETNNVNETNYLLHLGEKKVYISYKSLKNKQNQGSVYISLNKIGKNKISIEEHSSPMKVGKNKIIKSKVKTDKYYWKKIRPQIKLVENSILNKEALKYNETRLFNRTFINPSNNETLVNQYEMNLEVYFIVKHHL